MPAAGRIIGDYVLGAPIGSGASSEVYGAVGRGGEEVAIKLLRELGERSVRELLDEAARTAAIRHPNVVRVLGAGRDPATGGAYLVMERLRGETLAARLAIAGRLDEAAVRAIGVAIADGMDAVHACGIVHRDLKPANIVLGEAGRLTILDFGIARHLGGESAVTTSRRVGTLAYMAPEQLTGGLIAPCVDVWALGAILFEAATGRLPFLDFQDGRCPQLFDTAPRAASLAPISPALDALLARCLERDPGRRLSSMREVRATLRAAEPAERITEDAGALAPAPALDSAELVAQRAPSGEAPAGAPAAALRPSPRVRGANRTRSFAIAAAALGTAGVLAGAALVGPDRCSGTASGPAVAAVASSTDSAHPGSAPPPPATSAGSATVPAGPAAVESVPGREPAAPVGPARVAPARVAPAPAPRRAARAAEAPRAVTVEIRTTPPQAEIYVDGARRGVTPARLTLPAGAAITLRRRGYVAARVRAQGGPIDLRLVPTTASGEGLD